MPEDDVKKPFLSGKHFVLIFLVAGLSVAGISAVKFAAFRVNDKSGSNVATFTVKRGPLRISVTESGTIKARDQVILKSEVEGRTTILWLIDEGVGVEKGDLLVELDASTLLDTKIDQQIKVQNTEALFITARENLAVVENQAQSDVELADLTLKFAILDLKKYKEGDYPNLRKEAQVKITLAVEELERAEETLTWSKKLFNEKYISNTELQADELSKKKANLNLELAKNGLDLLEKFTNSRTLSQLNSDIKQAEMALERDKRKAKANIAQAKADYKAKESEFNRQKDKLAKQEEQITKTKIYAPASGQVIYATSAQRASWRRSSSPLDIGQDVQERQELIYLPTSDSSKAEVDIHESSLKKVQVGLPTIITVDAIPGKIFLGEVANIAPLPDATSIWLNPDLKVYSTEIYIDSNDPSLRTGMSCKAEVIVEQYEEALYIPVQAVLRVGRDHTVYVVTDQGHEAREVEIGMDNNRMVRIISGLEEGEKVMLTPPLKAAELGQSAGTGRDESKYDNGSELYQNINGRLEEHRRQPAAQQNGGRGRRNGRGGGRQGDQKSDSANSEERRKQFENLSDEEKEKMKKRFENMSPEDKAKMRRKRGGGRQGR